ncbi:hypothetical protein quinque_009294 [Culex quinquefasciatus]
MTLPTMRRLDRHMWQRQLRQLLRRCSAKTSTTPASIAYTGTIQSLANSIKSGATQPNYNRWNVCQVGHLQYGGSDNSSSTVGYLRLDIWIGARAKASCGSTNADSVYPHQLLQETVRISSGEDLKAIRRGRLAGTTGSVFGLIKRTEATSPELQYPHHGAPDCV